MATEPDDDVPKLPRSRGLKLSRKELVRVAMTALLLVLVIVVARPCAEAMSNFVTSFGGSDTPSSAMPRPGTVDKPHAPGSAGDYEQLRPDMTEAEIKAAIERAKARAKVTGSGRAGSAGSAAGSGSARP
jgi:hypothetical protein